MRLLSSEATAAILDKNFSGISRKQWVLSTPGPARFGYCYQHPCKQEWLGRTREELVTLAQNTRNFLRTSE